jgi:hypothetical protein
MYDCGHSYCYQCFEKKVVDKFCVICKTERIYERSDISTWKKDYRLQKAGDLISAKMALDEARKECHKMQQALFALL